MRRWVKVLTVLSRTTTLRQKRSWKLSISVVKKTPIISHSSQKRSQKSLKFSKSQRSQVLMIWTAIYINFIALYSYYLTTIDSLYTVNMLITCKKIFLNQHRNDTTTYMKNKQQCSEDVCFILQYLLRRPKLDEYSAQGQACVCIKSPLQDIQWHRRPNWYWDVRNSGGGVKNAAVAHTADMQRHRKRISLPLQMLRRPAWALKHQLLAGGVRSPR